LLGAVEQASTKEFLLRLVGLLVFALVVAGAYILHLRSQARKPLASKFEFDPREGYYIERKTGHAVCARCIAAGAVVHLWEVGSGCHQCKTCGQIYKRVVP